MSFFFQRSIYNVSLFFFRTSVWLAAFFNPKARLLANGQKALLNRISKDLENKKEPLVWFHCASLGEFEQGRPVIEAFRKAYPNFKILLTFFSPSGYEIRKSYGGADYIYYLPFDSIYNAQNFIKLAKPKLVVFVKYEFWFHYLSQLKEADIPVLLISAIFRSKQIFFKPYGQLYRKMLNCFRHIFVQNQSSIDLLNGIGINHVSLAGDTRFDRVSEVVQQAPAIPAVLSFTSASRVIVVGSCWPEDMVLLIPFINRHNEFKFILAPHETDGTFLKQLETKITREVIRYSNVALHKVEAEVLLVDTIGLLASLYQYGDYAFIGGAFGKGLHNILEAASFGMPIFFGNRNYKKFQEAVDLISRKGAFAVADTEEFEKVVMTFEEDKDKYQEAARQSSKYVQKNIGATEVIMMQIRELNVG